MTRFSRRPTEASLRAAERRKREDECTRLIAVVPKLAGLSMEFEERMGDSDVVAARHKRHIPVATAPALFEIQCSDSNCKDGGHDLTWPILDALKALLEASSGEDACHGQVGSASCRRVLHYMVRAKYNS